VRSLGLDGKRVEPEDLRQDRRVAIAASGRRLSVGFSERIVAEALNAAESSILRAIVRITAMRCGLDQDRLSF